MRIPIIQGYKHPPTAIGGGKIPTITTNLAHRTSSYGLPHIMEIYENRQEH